MIKKIILAALTVVWIVGFVLCWNFLIAGPNYWIAFLFGLTGFAVAAISEYLLEKGNRSTTETGYIPIYYIAVFVVLMMVLNLSFAFVPMLSLMPVFIVANLLLILIYGVLVYGAAKHLMRVNELAEYAPGKMKNAAAISQQLSVLLSIAKDTGVRQELFRLNENVAYSNNTTQSFSEGDEEAFIEHLNQIQEALSNDADTDTVMETIRAAAVTWSRRNSSLSNAR